VNVRAGFALSGVFIGGLACFDVGGIGHVGARQGAWPFLVVLWFFTGLTFASAQAGMAVMSLAGEGEGGGGKRARTPRRLPVAAVPVVADKN
jgi:hypothetical protein